MCEAVRLEVAVAAALLQRVEHLNDVAVLDGRVVHGAEARSPVAAALDPCRGALRPVATCERDHGHEHDRGGGERR